VQHQLTAERNADLFRASDEAKTFPIQLFFSRQIFFFCRFSFQKKMKNKILSFSVFDGAVKKDRTSKSPKQKTRLKVVIAIHYHCFETKLTLQ